MNTLNELGKRFVVLFVITLCALAVCALVEWGWRTLRDWWFWFPAKVGSDSLEWLQAHPYLLMVVICAVMAFIGALLSRRGD
jgi:TRAP-type C4-dicarboxylate transport system permease small subunit